MDPSIAAMDNVEEENMYNLEKVGNELLLQNVKRMNVNTFVPFELNQTNAQALDRCVHSLSHSTMCFLGFSLLYIYIY